MPEGDTVWRACQQLNAALAGCLLTRTEFRVPALATTDLGGVRIDAVVSRGKHQLFRFDNGFTLHSHFRMDGSWRIYPRGQKWTGGPAFQIRAILQTEAHAVIGYQLPVLELLSTSEEEDVVGHLGPDLLGKDWDVDEALRRLRRQPGRSIGEALLDQRNLAGIGTFYRAEILFLQGLHPRRPVEGVPDLTRVLRRAHQLLFVNRWRPEQSTTGNLRSAERAYVFERAGQPCRRCGTTIRAEEFGTLTQERRSYWCPRCQPAVNGD